MLCDSVRDAIALQTTDLNYDLQPMAGDSVKMHVLMDHYNQLQLTLEECHAVTPNGIRIQISASQEGQTLTLSKDMTEMKGNATFSVFITAELFKPTPYGEAATQEYPPRIPFLRPTYSLYLYTDEELKNKDLGDGYLMIGRVIMDNGQVRLDDTYIPPCSCVIVHPSLQNLYHRIRSFYGVEPSKLNMNDCLNGAVITIYCDSPLKNDETITAIASKGAIVGKINVMKNSHYQDLTVNVYVIKSYLTDKNYTNDYGKKVVDNKLSEIGGLQAIKNYLNKKSLNQALIQVNLIDIDEKGKPFDWGFRKSSLEIANKGLDPEFNNDNAPTNIFYTEFKDMLVDKNKMLFDDGKFINFQFEKKYKKYINKKSIFLYLTSLNSQDSGGAAFLVPLNNKHCIIFNSNLKNLPSYAHEIGHTFGLTHTFPENNRDYDNKIRIFKDDSELRRQWLIRNERIANIYQVKFEKHHMKRSENIQKSYEKIKKYDIFRFEKSKTDNILDYHNKRISFTQWQIKIMQNEVEKYYNDKE